jgi:hypothetical protein
MLDDFIYEIEDICSNDFCDFIIEKFKKDPNKHKGVTSSGDIDTKQKISVDLFTKTDDWKDINIQIFKMLERGKSQYMKHLRIKGIDKRGENKTEDIGVFEMYISQFIVYSYPILAKTSENGYFNWHSDYVKGSDRILTYLLYLNDNFEGGETEFACGKVIKPKKGKLLIFPSSPPFVHRGCKVKSGDKYVVNCFLSGYT